MDSRARNSREGGAVTLDFRGWILEEDGVMSYLCVRKFATL